MRSSASSTMLKSPNIMSGAGRFRAIHFSSMDCQKDAFSFASFGAYIFRIEITLVLCQGIVIKSALPGIISRDMIPVIFKIGRAHV